MSFGLTKIIGFIFVPLGLAGCIETTDLSSSVVLFPSQNVNAPKSSGFVGDIETNDKGVHIVRNHGGGRIISVEAQRRRLLDWGGPVEIRGFCNSACVILTTLPNACVAPRSRIGFHSSNINFGPVGNAQIARYLRGGVRKKFLEEWQFVPHSDIHHIWGERYAELDRQTKVCGR